MMRSDTIAAIGTGLTDSGIGIVRISGENAVEVGDELFQSPSGKRILKNAKSHTMYYGFAVDRENNFLIDEVMAVVMAAPRSFTGENTVEIQCHGGILVMRKILNTALKCGARLAEPGEFTKRAFLNGRMDLSRAEAVMDVIRSQNEYALASSVSQLRGVLSKKVKEFRDEILYEVAFIESAIDDPEHFDLDGYGGSLSVKLRGWMEKIKALLSTAENGRFVREGIRTVIVGKPNVGKSSLLNCLVGEERAIVTEIAGTTRDILQETVRLGDISLNVVDTAGIRDTEDTVEKIGVDRAKKYARNADLIVYVADASVSLDENDREIADFIKDKNVIVLLNKSDLSNRVTEDDVRKMFQNASFREMEDEVVDKISDRIPGEISNGISKKIYSEASGGTNGEKGSHFAVIKTSALEGAGLDEFEEKVKEMFFRGVLASSSETVITNIRHREALEETLRAFTLVKKSIEDDMPEDFYSIDLMNAYASLGRIIGEEVDDDLVEEIFSKFCMGK